VDVALLYRCRVQVGHCIILDGIKFDFNDIISSYTKNDSERSRFLSVWIFYIIIILSLLIVDTIVV